MMKILLKYTYPIISILFLIGLILVVFVRQYIENKFYIMLINYYFWYVFGLFSGIFLAKKIFTSFNNN